MPAPVVTRYGFASERAKALAARRPLARLRATLRTDLDTTPSSSYPRSRRPIVRRPVLTVLALALLMAGVVGCQPGEPDGAWGRADMAGTWREAPAALDGKATLG